MRFLLAPVLILSFSGSAFGWGCNGHPIVALIARAHLTPAVSAEVDQLLRDNPIDPSLNRFCKDRPSDLMADSATWADDERDVDKTTADWHFLDIPAAVPASASKNTDVMQWCKEEDGKPGCIVTALNAQLKILKDKSQPGAERAEALRYVIHFVGDLSQPLHSIDNHDQGGGCTSLSFFGQERPQTLHSLWDSGIIARELTTGNKTTQEYAARLDAEFSNKWADWSKPEHDFAMWAWESHGLAISTAYGNLKPALPVAPISAGRADKAACDAEKSSVAAQHIVIGEEYYDAAVPVIKEQLVKAGYRLAALLNQSLD